MFGLLAREGVSQGPNLAPNPSFESGMEGEPDGWEPSAGASDATFLWDTSLGRTGTSSLKVSASQPFRPSWRTSDFIPIEPDRRYLFEVFSSTSDVGIDYISGLCRDGPRSRRARWR